MASSRMQLSPLLKAAEELHVKSNIISVDIDNPDCINHLGSPTICFIGKINHHDDSRFNGFAISVLACICRLKAASIPICLIYCDHLADEPGIRGSFYRDLLHISDICGTSTMKNLVSSYFSPTSVCN